MSLIGGGKMGKKGLETKNHIKQTAAILFAEKGFKHVTMKDICEISGLSRGGLYRHYDSTEQIFTEIVETFLKIQDDVFNKDIESGKSASVILNNIFLKYQQEMLDSKSSLSLAIYEYYSDKSFDDSENPLFKQYIASFNSWNRLLEYGIETGEFRKVDIKSIFNLIIFSYQGIRMYSRLVDIDVDIPERVISQLKSLILIDKNEGV